MIDRDTLRLEAAKLAISALAHNEVRFVEKFNSLFDAIYEKLKGQSK